MLKRMNLVGVTVVGLLIAAAAPCRADSISDFYQGKQVSITVGSGSGGGYDTYARTVARHFGRHIPGSPTIVVKNMAGAGSLIMTNYVANIAPKDGTALGAPQNIIPFEGLLHLLSKKGKKARFDAQKLNWIGSASRDTYLLIVRNTAPVKTFEDLKTHELVVGSSGPNTEHSMTANMWNQIFHTKLKVVTGYKGGADVMLALERGEVQGISGRGYSSLMSTSADLVESGKIRILLQFALQPDPHLKGVPFALDLIKSPFDKKVLKFIFTKYEILRIYFAPTGVPNDRVEALRTAFDAAMKDPGFLADAKKQRIEVDPVSGADVQKLIGELYNSPKDVVDRARTLLGGKK